MRTYIGALFGAARFWIPLACAATLEAQASHPAMDVGTRCQQDYQNGWQKDVGNSDVWNRCGKFNDQIRRTDAFQFYYNLRGAKPVLEQTNDGCGWGCGSADSVDFFYMNTHAGANSSAAFWDMWDQNSRAFSSNMRLGDTSRQLMVLATFACNTLQTSDGNNNVVARWQSPFAGGLVMTTGGHATLYDGNDQSATEFASRMQDGQPIGLSWLESSWYADNSNTPSFMNTGKDANDCFSRANVSLPTLFQTPILRDSAVGYYCWASWN